MSILMVMIFTDNSSQTSTPSFELVFPATTSRNVASDMASTKFLLRRPTFSSSSSVTSLVPFYTVSRTSLPKFYFSVNANAN